MGSLMTEANVTSESRDSTNRSDVLGYDQGFRRLQVFGPGPFAVPSTAPGVHRGVAVVRPELDALVQVPDVSRIEANGCPDVAQLDFHGLCLEELQDGLVREAQEF
jgi:hypothetical protein